MTTPQYRTTSIPSVKDLTDPGHRISSLRLFPPLMKWRLDFPSYQLGPTVCRLFDCRQSQYPGLRAISGQTTGFDITYGSFQRATFNSGDHIQCWSRVVCFRRSRVLDPHRHYHACPYNGKCLAVSGIGNMNPLLNRTVNVLTKVRDPGHCIARSDQSFRV